MEQRRGGGGGEGELVVVFEVLEGGYMSGLLRRVVFVCYRCEDKVIEVNFGVDCGVRGVPNQVADTLSRMYEEDEGITASFMAMSRPSVGLVNDLKNENETLEELRQLHGKLDREERLDGFRREQGLMLYQERLYDRNRLLWEVIMNVDAPAIASASTEGPIPPKTAEQKLARKNELKAKSTLLLAIPDEHLLKFSLDIKDEKPNRKLSRPRFHKLIIQFEIQENTSSTNEVVNTAHEVSTASSHAQASSSIYTDDVMFSFFVNQSNREDIAIFENNDDKQALEQVDTSEYKLDELLRSEGLDQDLKMHDIHKNNSEVFGYHAVPSPYNGNYMPSRPDLSFAGLDASVYKTNDNLEQPKDVRPSALVIEEWESDSDDDSVIRPSFEYNKPSYAQINFIKSDENTRKSVIEQHTNRQAKNLRKILTKSGNVPINTAKQSSSRAAVSNSTTRYVNTAATRPTVNDAKPSSNVFHKSHSSVKM
ncbi:hypothetical protein Tco_0629042 [Tanacetum coccineum]|uniref:Uncharacterized protein n=1 Tax=Tanacetum coccineum TaxID=301880 RepID=A0ABQ4WS78_9ASTR